MSSLAWMKSYMANEHQKENLSAPPLGHVHERLPHWFGAVLIDTVTQELGHDGVMCPTDCSTDSRVCLCRRILPVPLLLKQMQANYLAEPCATSPPFRPRPGRLGRKGGRHTVRLHLAVVAVRHCFFAFFVFFAGARFA